MSNKYTFPGDGYIVCSLNSNEQIVVDVYSSDEREHHPLFGVNGASSWIANAFVRKGMKCYIYSSAGSIELYFIELIS